MDNKKTPQNLPDGAVSKEETNLLKQDLASGQQRERRLRWAVIVSVLVAAIFLVLTSFGWIKSKEAKSQSATAQSDTYRALMLYGTADAQKSDAQEEAKSALAREIAAKAQLLLRTDSTQRMTTILLAIESMRLAPSGEASQIIRDALETPIFQSGYIGTSSAVFGADGRTVISIGSASFNTVQIWDVFRGEEIARVTQSESVFVKVSPDLRHVASVNHDRVLDTWTTLVGEINSVREIIRKSHAGPVSSIAYSPDGSYIASVVCEKNDKKPNCFQEFILIWEAATGKDITRIEYDNHASSVVFSPDGLHIASMLCDQFVKEKGCVQASARVWEVATGKEISRMTHEGAISAIEFSPDSKYVVSNGNDGTARVWEAATGKEIARMTGDDVANATFSPDGKYVASGWTSMRVWESGTGKEILKLPFSGGINFVTFSPDGKFLAFVGDASYAIPIIQIWEIATGKEVVRLPHDSNIFSFAFSPDGKYFLTTGKEIKVWEIFPGQVGVPSILYSFSPGKRDMVALKDNSPFVLDVGNNYQEIRSFGFSSNGKYLVMGNSDGTVSVLEFTTGNKISYLMHDASVGAVAISPNGKYVISGSGDNTACLWEVATGEEITRMVHSAPVSSVAFSPDGRYAASGSYDMSVYVWDTLTGKEVAHVVGMFVVFSPDSKYVVSGGANGIVSLWEVATGKEIMHILSDGGKAFFTPDGDYLIIGGQAAVSVWDMATGREISRVPYPIDSTLLGLSSDAERLLFVGNENIVEMKWRPEDLIADACSRVTRNLTSVEWQQYIGDVLPYREVCPNFQLEPTLMPIPTPTPIPTLTPTPTASPTPTPAPTNPTSTTQPTET